MLTAATLLVGASGCDRKPDPPASQSEPEPTPSPEEPGSEPAGTAADAKGPSGAPIPTGPMGEEPLVRYAAPLEPLLDLVPQAQGHFVAMRDPSSLLDLFDAWVGTMVPKVLPKLDSSAELGDVLATLDGVAKVRDAFIDAKVDLDRGFLYLEDQEVLVYATASDDPSAIKVALKAAGLGADALPPTCVALPKMPGFAGCGDDTAAIRELAPGNHGAAFKTEMAAALPGFDLERGNVLVRLDARGNTLLAAVATPPGQAHVVAGLGKIATELGSYLQAGPAPALGLLETGSAFVWARGSFDAFEAQIKAAPGPVGTVVDTLTGEFFAGGLRDPGGVAVLAGVNDPFPASGLVSLASLQIDALKPQLPPDSIVEVIPVDLGATKVQAVHFSLSSDAQGAQLADSMGFVSEGFGFSAGQYAGFVAGGGAELVKSVAGFDASAQPLGLVGVPVALSNALRRGEVAAATHIPFDALHSGKLRTSFSEALKLVPEETISMSPTELPEVVLGLLSPLSSVSWWLTHPSEERVVHVMVQGFSDTETDEGKAAAAALLKIVDGADPTSVYGELAKAYTDSPRATMYQARAGTDVRRTNTAAITTSFLLGGLAGVAIPAFTKYVERSKAAAAGRAP